MKTLKLFNAVIDNGTKAAPVILSKYGVVVDETAASQLPLIVSFLEQCALSGIQLNATFHKSWSTIINSSDSELRLHQILHYITTYGTGHQSTFIYTPNEPLDIPDITVEFLVVRGISKEQIVDKCLALFDSGAALAEDTITDVMEVLADCGYTFTGRESFRNKEVNARVFASLEIAPTDPVECIQCMVFAATGKSLLIKNVSTYSALAGVSKDSKVYKILRDADANELAKVFNRFKPIFLALKTAAPADIKSKINQISRLSKTKHVPMSYNILNNLGTCTVDELKAEQDNLINANFFQLARCLNYLKKAEHATTQIYNIRNGKSYVKERISGATNPREKADILLDILKSKYDLSKESVYIPEYVEYPLPTSEKSYVGNVPTGTKFFTDQQISYGVYWHNSDGAYDIDLSALSCRGKIGWNSQYCAEMMYSGDMTDARTGATEYVTTTDKMKSPHLVMINVFRGADVGSRMRIVLGNSADPSRDHMMDPNAVWFTAATETVSRSSIIGVVYRDQGRNCAVIVNRGVGAGQVSYANTTATALRTGLIEQYRHTYSLREALQRCGATLVNSADSATTDLTPSKLEKDSILSIFS